MAGGTVRTIEVPLFLGGREKRGDALSIDAAGVDGPVRVLLPEITATEIDAIGLARRQLAGLDLEEILSFLDELKARWADESSPLRREALELLEQVTGFHRRELELDLTYFSALLDRSLFLGPTLESELGEVAALDRWVPRGGSLVRAIPRGLALHVLAGNVPGVELLSLLRGLLTKNDNILKIAGGNPITPSLLARSMVEVDPDHPITRSTSVVYWPHGANVEASAYRSASTACVWGGHEAVAAAYVHARPGLEILDYGPKRSLSLIDRETVADDQGCPRAAGALARDVAHHDQLACHCPQVAFVERPARRFVEALADGLERASVEQPRGVVSIDQQTEVAHLRSMSELRGDQVLTPKDGGTGWTVIVTDDFGRTAETPLGRTLYLLEVDDLARAAERADPYTMVVGFSSPERLEALRDDLVLRGVDRLTLVGQMGLLPPGMPHEGRFDLTRLVRWVSTDRQLVR